MCTALSIKSKEDNYFFGRNMDLSYNFNQSVILIPRNYEYRDSVTKKTLINKRSIIGMGTVIDDFPAMADGMNENGLACAGLNFQGYAYFEETPHPQKTNIAPQDFVQWVLSNHDTVDEVKASLQNIELVAIPINSNTPIPPLHWMIVDKMGKAIVIEKTKDKLAIHDNPVGVMTNNPTFDWHLTNLNEYIYITPNQTKHINWSKHGLIPLGIGAGTLGMPGDFASVSRFVRIAYIRAHMPLLDNNLDTVTQFFHMLDYVKMVKGGVMTEDGIPDLTIYSSCMDQENGIYYYKTYDNNRINAVNLKKEPLEGKKLTIFSYQTKQDIYYQN